MFTMVRRGSQEEFSIASFLIVINATFLFLFRLFPLHSFWRSFDFDWLGIQISQIAIIATQCSMALLSIVLIIGIHTVSLINDAWFSVMPT